MKCAAWSLVALLATAAACDQGREVTSPAADLIPGVDPNEVDTHVPFSFAFVNPCTGEPFSGTGFFHFKNYVTTAPKFHMSVEMNFEDTKGVTLSGVRYVVPLESSDHMIYDSDFAPANATAEAMDKFIRQAEDGSFVLGDDFSFKLKMHFTSNAAGVITASFSDLAMECR